VTYVAVEAKGDALADGSGVGQVARTVDTRVVVSWWPERVYAIVVCLGVTVIVDGFLCCLCMLNPAGQKTTA